MTCKRLLHLSQQSLFMLVLLFGVVCLLLLIAADPNYMKAERHFKGPCPLISGNGISEESEESLLSSGVDSTHRKVNCDKLIQGDREELQYAETFNFCQRRDVTDNMYLDMLRYSCDNFKQYFYTDFHSSSARSDFPIAFSVLTYQDTEQTLRLLRSIYQPHHVYCVHVDAKSPSSMFNVFTSLSQCFPNVFVPRSPVRVHWAEYSVLAAELLCMQTLWNTTVKWKYYINLTGREFPLRTGVELEEILKSYNGANDIDGSWYHRNVDWVKYVWRNEYWRTNTEKSPVPHKFNILKGSAHITASRAFVDYVLHNQKASDLREWMKDTRLPDEHFFNTLNNNPHFNISGAFRGDPHTNDFLTRFKVWQQDSTSRCSGQWSRYVCNLGVQELPDVTRQKHLFVNKLHMDVSPVAFECLEQWHRNRTRLGIGADFDVNFYRNLKFVKYHVL